MVCFGLFWLIVAFYAIVLFVVARYGWVGMHGFGIGMAKGYCAMAWSDKVSVFDNMKVRQSYW